MFDVEELTDVVDGIDAQFAVVAEKDTELAGLALAEEVEGDAVAGTGCEGIGQLRCGGCGDVVDGHKAVAHKHAAALAEGAGGEVLDDEGPPRSHKVLGVLGGDAGKEVGAEVDSDQAIGTEQGGGFGVAEHKFLGGGGEVVHLLSVDGVDNVAVLETLVKKHLVVLVAETRIAQRELVFAPVGEDGSIDDEGGDEVDEDAAGDDEEALPAGFGAVFPRLGGAFEVGGGLGFVHHAGNVAVAAEGYPAETPKGVVLVLGPEVLLVPGFGSFGVEEEEVPFAVEFFGFKDGELPVEEDVKTPHTGVEKFGKTKMTELVGDDEEGHGEDEY